MDCRLWSRRAVLVSGSVLTASLAMGAERVMASGETLARDAVVWGFPLVFFGLYLDAAMTNGVAFNRFYIASDIADAHSKAVGPNIDTLNGRAWLDLDAGPQVIGVPDTGNRYYTIQLQDMYMNSFAFACRHRSRDAHVC